jgi:IS5 family transposase
MRKATIDTGLKMKVITPAQIARVHMYTTVQTKAGRFPKDARLYDRARERLVKTARKQGLSIKQSYERVGRRLLMAQSRYAHARQMKRAQACTRKLRTNLGLLIREIERQQSQPQGLRGKLLETAKRIRAQERGDGQKVYSVHEPEVACIPKCKPGKKCEFGNKVSLAATSKGGWLRGALSLLGNPYDGHTLDAQLA